MPHKDPVKRRAYKRSWHNLHKDDPDFKDRANDRGKRWYHDHPRSDERKAKILENNKTPHARYVDFRYKSRKRGFDFSISFDTFLELRKLPCTYCGGRLPEWGSGVDRANPNIGYVQGNVVPCCTICNLSKRTMSENEFKEWILKVMNYWVSPSYQ